MNKTVMVRCDEYGSILGFVYAEDGDYSKVLKKPETYKPVELSDVNKLKTIKIGETNVNELK